LAKVAAILLAGLPGAHAWAAPLYANIALTVDDESGQSIDLDVSVSPNDHLTLSANAGHSSGSAQTSNVRGTALGAGASLQGERTGAALDYQRFDDQTNYLLETIGARAWIDAGDLRIALLGRHRATQVELTLALPQRTLRRQIDYSALGGGIELSFTHGKYSIYGMALGYDYDDHFDDFVALIDSPLLVSRPRVEALVGSFITQAQGAIDQQAGSGIEHSFGRHTLALDLSWVHDALLDAASTSATLTWRYTRSAHFDWSISAGMIDSARYGEVAFASVALGLGN